MSSELLALEIVQGDHYTEAFNAAMVSVPKCFGHQRADRRVLRGRTLLKWTLWEEGSCWGHMRESRHVLHRRRQPL